MSNSLLMPNDIFIEITSKCNMDCIFCPYGVLKRPLQDMKEEYVFKILAELKDLKARGFNIPSIAFHCLGEPLLNKNLSKYMSFCDDNDLHYWLVTNGLLLNQKRSNELFLHKNLDKVEFSFHTISERAFALRGMRNYPFSKYLEQIKNVIFNEKRLEQNVPIQIDVMFDCDLENGKIFNAYDKAELKEFLEIIWSFKKEYEALHPEIISSNKSFYKRPQYEVNSDAYCICIDNEGIPNRLLEPFTPKDSWVSWEVFPKFLITIKRFFLFTPNKAYMDRVIGSRGTYCIDKSTQFFKCNLANSLVILSNGTISYCCLDYEGALSFGNIKDVSLEEALNSPKRQALLKNVCTSDYCKECCGKKTITWNIDCKKSC